MAAITFLGRSLILACCGFLYLKNDSGEGDITITYNSTILENETKIDFDYPSWIAPPTIKNISGPNNFDKDAEIDINIDIPAAVDIKLADRRKTEIIVTNKTLPKSNIIQINIFNNGSPISSPIIIHTSNSSNDISKSSLQESLTINASSKALSSLTFYSPPNETALNETLPWWKTSIIYQIYPRSFKDSTGSGTGDLGGITSKIGYLKDLGIGAIWISPFYVSPMADFGYDIQDFKNVDPTFGSLEDFNVMQKEIQNNGLKLIMDFIPNHSSDKHEWFQKSLNRTDPFTDYYVWKNPKGYNESGDPIPPNNWLSFFGGSAWEWSPEREQFYLHQFLKEQPDLNVRNPLVMDELDNILRFWLDLGVDGFRVDALKFLFEIEDMNIDEQVDASAKVKNGKEYYYLKHTLSVNQPETVEAVRRWRKILDSYPGEKAMIVEVYDDDINQIVKYYESPNDPISNFPFNFFFITEFQNRSDVTGLKLKETTEKWMNSMPSKDNWPNWVLGNHDRLRVATRLGEDLVDAMNMLLLLLPGTPTTYYGEEIGMEDHFISYEDAKDPFGLNFGPERYAEFGRDPQRTPMQWDDTLNAGFSENNDTWLPVHSNFMTVNVKNQQNTEQSTLKIYKQLARLRQMDVFQRGNFSFPFVNDDIIALKRSLTNEPSYMLLINTSTREVPLNLLEGVIESLPNAVEVILRSSFDTRTETSPRSQVELSMLSLLAGEGLLLKIY